LSKEEFELAEHFIRFAENLTLVGDYSGEAVRFRDWQRQIAKGLFRTALGKRIVSKAFILLARKNGKTLLCAIICLYFILTQRNQQVLSAASCEKQARLIFDAMRQMIEADEVLSDVCTIVPSTGRISVVGTNSFYVAVSSGGAALHGLSPTVVIMDELHAFKNNRHRDLYAALTTGSGARKNKPLIVMISTQTADRDSVAWEEFEYARSLKNRIENGRIVSSGKLENPSYLACLYFADPDKHDWTDPNVHRLVNPGLGDFINPEEFEEEFRLALQAPSLQQQFKQFRLNMLNCSSSKWLDMGLFDKCISSDFPDTTDWVGKGEKQVSKGPLPKLPEGWKALAGGLDLAPVKDLSAFSVIFQASEGKTAVMPFVWCNADDIHLRSKTENVPYSLWKEKGFIKTTPGSSTDFEIIRQDIRTICEFYRVPLVAADAQHAYQLGQQLVSDGIEVQWVKPYYTHISPPMRHLEKLVVDQNLIVPKHPVMSYCFANVVAETDGQENIKPSNRLRRKQDKIDIAVATILGLAVCMPKEKFRSKYEDDEGDVWL